MKRFVLLLLLILVGIAHAGPVDSERTAMATAEQALHQVLGERAGLARQHEVLATEIGALKAKDASILKGVDLGGALDARLKASQKIGTKLAELDRRVAEARSAVDIARTVYSHALDVQIAERRSALGQLPRAEQRAEFTKLGALIAERGRLTTVTSKVATRVELPGVANEAGPDELRDLAIETEDHAEKIGARLDMLASRLDALQSRRRLLRAAVAFHRDDALFAEDERNRRLVRADQPKLAVATAERSTDEGKDVPSNIDSQAPGGLGATETPPSQSPEPPPTDPSETPDSDNNGQPESGAGDDTDGDGVLDAAAEVEPVRVATPGGFVDQAGAGLGESFVISDAFDPGLLTGDIEDLSSADLAEQIRAVEARRKRLRQTAQELANRKQALEKKARELEGE